MPLRWSKLDQAYAFLADHGHLQGLAFVDAAIDHLNLRPTVEPEGERRIPAQGRLLIVANHPSGALDALALLQLVGRVRRDVRIVANDFLMDIAPLAELLLPVRILGGRAQRASLQAVEQALQAEQCVIVFPAGEVSRLGPRGVRDTRWRRGFLRFARATGAPVLPIRVQARNSPLFYGASALFKPAGTALLAREMFRRSQRCLHLHVGQVLQHQRAPFAELALARLELGAAGVDAAEAGFGTFAVRRPGFGASDRVGAVDEQAALEKLVTGGDDYEIAFTASPRDEAALRREAERRHLRLTRIGRVTTGQGVVARFGGQPVTFARTGFTHG